MWELSPKELDGYLSKNFVSVRTPKGLEYEPTSLRSMLGSFERILKRHKYGYSLITGVEFALTRSAMKAKQKDLKSQGKGNKPMKAQPLTDADIDKLYETGQLGTDNPSSLINTLWFNNTLYFGMRGGATEQHALEWADVTLHSDPDCEYLEYNERTTKTRTGADTTNTRACPPRMYATPDNPDRCPVNVYKAYAEHRPEMPTLDAPFYLSVVTHDRHPSPTDRWFLRIAMGVNKLCKLMSKMATAAGLPPNKRISNTSVRKTLVQKMTDGNVPDNLQVYVTGHKNPASLNNYRHINDQQKFAISRVLSAPSTATCSNSTAPQQSVSYLDLVGASERSSVIPAPAPRSMPTASQQTHSMESLFAGSNITGGSISVNINYNYNYSAPVKRRRIIMSDSDSD
jgi:hypothetical protein